MSGVLVMAEARQGELREISLELVEAGRRLKDQLGGPLVVGVVAKDAGGLVDALNVEGVDEIVTVASPREHFEAHLAEQALEALVAATEPAVILLGHTIDSLGYGPAIAAKAGMGFASDAMSIEADGGAPVVRRGAYGDRLVARVEFPGRDRVLVLVRAGSYEPASGAGSAQVRALDVSLDESQAQTEHVEYREAAAGDVDITKSEFLLSIGRGVDDKDNLEQFQQLADTLGATLSVSRPLVDAGWMPNSRQVGQSGKTVKPKVYLALGISGAVQHLAGMRKADTIIAVNTDPEAPIFNVAHYGAVADLFDVADALPQHFE
jgi:electron transfer flavoprotein alpha subunit